MKGHENVVGLKLGLKWVVKLVIVNNSKYQKCDIFNIKTT